MALFLAYYIPILDIGTSECWTSDGCIGFSAAWLLAVLWSTTHLGVVPDFLVMRIGALFLDRFPSCQCFVNLAWLSSLRDREGEIGLWSANMSVTGVAAKRRGAKNDRLEWKPGIAKVRP
ncbi:hypothetical protein V2G26_014614 [Clonostachys chloroleuca]